MAQQQSGQPSLSGMNLMGAVDLSDLKHKVTAAQGEAGGAPEAGKYVVDVSLSTFEATIRASLTYPILLLVWIKDDDRCFPVARRLAKAVNALDGQIQLVRIEANENPQITQALRVQGVPSLFAVISGQPIPIMEGVPHEQALEQLEEQVIPQILETARRAGVTGRAPYSGDSREQTQVDANGEEIPPTHAKADALEKAKDYAGAAEEYATLMKKDASDERARRHHALCLLLARNGASDVRAVRAKAADNPDDVDAQLDVADVDMIGGKVEDAFSRILDFMRSHPGEKNEEARDAARTRLLEYFDTLDKGDARVKTARRRLAMLLY